MARQRHQQQRAVAKQIVGWAKSGQGRAAKIAEKGGALEQVGGQQAGDKRPGQRAQAASAQDAGVCLGAQDDARLGKIEQAGQVVGVQVRENDPADVGGREAPARQLRGDGKLGAQAQRRSAAVERERPAGGLLLHARRIAGVPQAPAVLRVLDQRHQRVAGDRLPPAAAHHQRLVRQAVAGVKDVAGDVGLLHRRTAEPLNH